MATKLLSIEEIMTGVSTASIEMEKGARQTQELVKAQVSASERKQDIYGQAAKDAELVISTQKLADLNVQKENIRAAEAAGISEGTNDVLEYLDKLRQANRRVVEKAAEVRYKWDSTTERDGVFGWIKNGLTVGSSQNELQARMFEAEAIAGAMAQTHTALQQAYNSNKGKAASVTAESAAAAARLAASQSKAAMEDAVLEGVGYNIAGITAAKNATIEQLNLRYSGQSAVQGIRADQRAAESQGLERQRFEWQKEMATLQRETLEAEKKSKEEAKVLDDATVANIELGRATLHLPRMTEGEKALILRQVRSGSLKGDVLLHHHLGLKSRQNGGRQVFGNSPSAAAEVVFNPDPELDVKVAEAQIETKELLAEAYKAVPLQVKNSKDRAAISREFDKQAALLVAQQFGDEKGVDGAGYVGSESAFNIGDIGDLRTGYLDAAAVKDLPIVTRLLKPLAANKVAMKDPGAVLDLVRAAVKKGELTSTQAADGLANVYKAANWMHQEQRNFDGYGFKLPNNGGQYIVKIGGKRLDLTRPEHIQRMLMQPANSTRDLLRDTAPLGYLFR